ncbi:MAG: HPr family phosphocarrier protein [Candidatus Edwardsbacteria bacterium]
MTEAKVRIVNRLGMHARPAALFVKTAGRHKSQVWVSKGELKVNGKSIMGVMMLAAEYGSELIIQAEGVDEKETVGNLVALVNGGFGEE